MIPSLLPLPSPLQVLLLPCPQHTVHQGNLSPSVSSTHCSSGIAVGGCNFATVWLCCPYNHIPTFCTASLPVDMKYLKLIKWRSPAGVLREYRLVEHVSTKWRQFGTQITLTQNTMDGWFSDTHDTESCWERVMQAWLQGRGKEEYPPTWEGLFKLLQDIRKEAVVPVLREAVDRAVLPGTSMLSSKVCNYQLNCVCFSTRSFPVMSVLLLLLFKRGIYNCSSNCFSFMHSILSPLPHAQYVSN